MRRLFLGCLLLLAASLVTGSAFGDEKTDYKSNAFFKHLIGSWTCDGELKGADGKAIPFKSEWKADVEGENTFVIEGKRVINKDAQDYKWTIIHNPTTGGYEAMHKSGSSEAQRFEVQVVEDEMRMEMMVLGNGNGKLTVIDSFKDKNLDEIETKVTLTDDSGTTTLSGTLVNKRVKTP